MCEVYLTITLDIRTTGQSYCKIFVSTEISLHVICLPTKCLKVFSMKWNWLLTCASFLLNIRFMLPYVEFASSPVGLKGTREPLFICRLASLCSLGGKGAKNPIYEYSGTLKRITVLKLKAHCLHFATLNMAAVFLNCLLKGWSCFALPICYLYESTVL